MPIDCRFYITPKSFLDLLSMFASMLGEQHAELTGSRERLVNGLTKLQDTNAAVDVMQQQLNALQPTLQQKTASAEQLLAQVRVYLHCAWQTHLPDLEGANFFTESLLHCKRPIARLRPL